METNKVIDTEKFINEVRTRPIIWDLSCEDYQNKMKKQEVWIELCKSMFENYGKFDKDKKSKTCKYLQKKWKNIRNCYTRELRKRKGPKSHSDTKNHKKYMYFDSLSFLLPHTNISIPNAEDLNGVLELHPKVSRKSKKRIINTSSPAINTSYHPEHNFESQSCDEDRMFLLSLVSDLANIHPERKLFAKMEIMSVILKFKNESPNNFYSYNYYSNNNTHPNEPSSIHTASPSPESLPLTSSKRENSNSAYTSSTPTASTTSESSSASESGEN